MNSLRDVTTSAKIRYTRDRPSRMSRATRNPSTMLLTHGGPRLEKPRGRGQDFHNASLAPPPSFSPGRRGAGIRPHRRPEGLRHFGRNAQPAQRIEQRLLSLAQQTRPMHGLSPPAAHGRRAAPVQPPWQAAARAPRRAATALRWAPRLALDFGTYFRRNSSRPAAAPSVDLQVLPAPGVARRIAVSRIDEHPPAKTVEAQFPGIQREADFSEIR